MTGWRSLAAMLIAPVAIAAATPAAQTPIRFTFVYPPQVRAVPALAAWFAGEEARMRSAVTAQAVADQRDAVKSGNAFNPYETSRIWKVVTDTPRFLSLSVERYDYTGGAHGMTDYASLVWDKAKRQRRTTLSFFDPAALRVAVTPAFCRRLDAERRAKRGGTLETGLPEFSRCIDPIESAVLLGSSSHARFDRIGFMIAPYAAGPYAEGVYEVTLPVTAAVLAAVKPEWRPYFKTSTPGSTNQ